MKTMHIGKFKAQFSDVVQQIKKGNTIRVVKGKSEELVGYFTPKVDHDSKIKKRILGEWGYKGKVKFIGGINTSEEEFFGI